MNIPSPPVHVTPWDRDEESNSLYCLVFARKRPSKTERIDLSAQEVAASDTEPERIRELAFARMRDAIARLCGFATVPTKYATR